MMSEEQSLNPKNRGLGRGLNALFDDEEENFSGTETAEEITSASPKIIGVEYLEPHPDQPRQVFDEQALQDLTESIKEHGVLQPILVRPNRQNPGHFEIIAGERRWRASQRAQLHEVPIVVYDMDDTQTLQVALIENLQRDDLNAIEEAKGYQRLMDDFDQSADEVAKSIGKSRSYVANITRLLGLPNSVQVMVMQNQISAGHARALLKAPNPTLLAQEVVQKGLSVRETEKLAAMSEGREIQSRSKDKNAGKVRDDKDADTLALEREMSNLLGMDVVINMKDNQKGTLSVGFRDLDQLDNLLQRLSHMPQNLNTIDGV